MFYGLGFDPAESAPAILAIIVGVLVWRRHRVDRRARLFLVLATFEFLLGLPLAILAANLPEGRFGIAMSQAFVITPGLLATTLFLHFGLAFPHARPWLKRGHIGALYLASIAFGALGFLAAMASVHATTYGLEIAMIVIAIAVVAASVGACVAVYRSYREMTRDERARYRLPVMGVLVGMIAGFSVDLLMGVVYGTTYNLDARYVLWTANVVGMTSELLLPLFFFMAAVKYGLLEHHSQDFVGPPASQ